MNPKRNNAEISVHANIISSQLRNASGKYDEYDFHSSLEMEAADVIDRLMVLLAHAVEEADGWHDDSHGGPIQDDALIDEARGIAFQCRSGKICRSNGRLGQRKMKRSEKIYAVLDIIAWGFFDHVQKKWKRGVARFVGYLIAFPIFALTAPIQAVLILAMTACEMWEESNGG